MGGAYEALAVAQSAQLYLLVGLLGLVVYLLLVLTFFFVPHIKTQHPAADLVVWHATCGFMTSGGFVAGFVLQRHDGARSDEQLLHWQCAFLAPFHQFFFLAGTCWYLMLTLDLLVALVNPWMGYRCKSWTYHTMYDRHTNYFRTVKQCNGSSRSRLHAVSPADDCCCCCCCCL